MTRGMWALTATVALATVAAVVLAVVVLTGGPDPLEAAQQECETAKASVTSGDGGNSLTVEVDGGGAQRKVAAYDAGLCVLDELGAPDSLVAKVEGTSALMGRQSDAWGDYEATWDFSPGNGLSLVVEKA